MRDDKQGWDTRAWLIGTLGGLFGGGVSAWTGDSAAASRLHLPVLSLSDSNVLCPIAAVLSLLVLPGILSSIARHLTFLWGLLPLLLFLVSFDGYEWAGNGYQSVVRDFGQSLTVTGGCLVLSSGSVSLIRYLRGYSLKKQEAAQDAFLAQRDAASIPQEGVWPPPPDYRQ